jgi:hypothetical protein
MNFKTESKLIVVLDQSQVEAMMHVFNHSSAGNAQFVKAQWQKWIERWKGQGKWK